MELGEDATEKSLDVAGEGLADKVERLTSLHKKSVLTAELLKYLKRAGDASNLYGAAKAGIQGRNNFANCELQP